MCGPNFFSVVNLFGKIENFENFSIFSISSVIVKHEQNRRYKLILEIELSKGVPVSFSPTRLIIFFLHADWLER